MVTLPIYLLIHILGIIPTYIAWRSCHKFLHSSGGMDTRFKFRDVEFGVPYMWTRNDRIRGICLSVVFSVFVLGLIMALASFVGLVVICCLIAMSPKHEREIASW